MTTNKTRYYKKLISTCLIISGSFLILEHMWSFNRIDLIDVIGHETLGIVMILTAFLLMTDWSQWKKLKLKNPKNWFR